MNKLNRDKEYTTLLRKLQEAKSKHPYRPGKVTEIYLEIAEYMRNGLFKVDEAKENYNKVIFWGKDADACALDSSLAYRNLAEMAIEEGELDSAIEKISKSLECAYKSNDPSVIQQALHQRALICLSCDLPKKALDYAEECKNYLLDNSDSIDALKKDGDSRCRLAHLQNLTAGIYLALDGGNRKGLDINEKAIKYASEKSDWTLYYRCLLTKLNLTIGRERVQIAEMMSNIAGKVVPKNADEKKFKRESKCHLALEKLRYCDQGNVAQGKKLLWKCFEDLEKEPESVSADLYGDVKRALMFVYKVEQREKKANSMNLKDNSKRRHAQMVIFEKIGDDASNVEMNEIALHFYQKMLKCADSVEDQRNAWCSMAEAAKDCNLFERAVEFYKQARTKEVELGYTADQLLETDIAIAILSAEIKSISPNERLKRFREVYLECTEDKHKRNILPDYIKFMKTHPNLCAPQEIDEKLRERIRLEGRMADEYEVDENETETLADEDEFDAMNEVQILFALKREMKALDKQEKIIKERGNKNKHGESSLHEVARSDDYQQLKELIEKGYDVNQLDHGNWTPLSEAVSAQQLANVRLLLMNGANPNTRSTESLVDDDRNKITSSGLSPLMEACSFGNIDIAKILLQFKARTSTKDDDDWTALEYLWEFLRMHSKELDRPGKERLQRFGETIKQKQTEEGFTPRTYNEFLDLLELKKVAFQRNADRKSSSSNASRQWGRSSVDGPCPPNSPERPPSAGHRNAWIDNDSEGENRGNCGEDEEESENEETRNLDDYRKCISGLRKRRNSSEDAEFSRSTLRIGNRKRPSGSSAGRNGLSLPNGETKDK